MDQSLRNVRSLVLLDRVVRAQAITGLCMEELRSIALTQTGLHTAGRLVNLLGSDNADSDKLYRHPIVDMAAMTVTWSGLTCRLGHTFPLRMMERLARRPNHYIPFDRLLRDVWDGHTKSDETIRSTIRHLKIRLIEAGMRGLATSIRGADRKYGLILNELD